MKLIFALLLVAGAARGQTADTLFMRTTEVGREEVIAWPKPYIDTVAVVMLCSDTTDFDDPEGHILGYLHSSAVRGFEVRIVDPMGTYDKETTLAIYIPRSSYTHLAYLDAHKKPLPKNIIVWLTK